MKDRAAWTALAEELGHKAKMRALVAPAGGRQKYGNHVKFVDGFRFDSKKEAARYPELKYAQAAGKIADLELQPAFVLYVSPLREVPGAAVPVGQFTADFRYLDLGLHALGEIVTEDVKSEATKTTAYKLRKRIVEALYDVTIVEK